MAVLVHAPELTKVLAKIISDPNPNANARYNNSRRLSILGRNEKTEGRLKATFRIECLQTRVSDLGRRVSLYGQFSAPVKDDLKNSNEQEEKQDFYLNMGYAIRTLREDFPEMFYKELSFDIYRDDIVFRDPLNTFAGIESYKSIFWALRFHGRIFFQALWLDIISVWQPVESVVMVRWTVHGVPRVLWESHGRFDGISEYKFDKNGKIYEHCVYNIALNSPPKFHMITVQDLIQSIGGPSTPKPTYFEISEVPTNTPR